jgi:ATP-dependent protease ClpP protease subunit
VAGINGDDFAREMEFLAAQGVEEVIIDINSVGGSIKEGFSIFTAIKDAPFKTVTRVVGIAASMAGIISQAGDHRIILDYGIFHAHGPQVPKGKVVEASLLNKMLGSLKTMIATRSSLPENKITEMLSKETVLTALEATEMGFFDEIERTKGLKPELEVSNDVEAIFEMVNEYINNNDKMDKLNKFLELENATEDELLTKVTELKEGSLKVEELTNEVSESATKIEELNNEIGEKVLELEANATKLTELETEVKNLKTVAATELVENAIKLGKITEESKSTWLTQASNDMESTKVLLSGITNTASAAVITNEIEAVENKEDRKDWDFQKWGQDDPQGLEEMRNESPEKFELLFNEYTK